MNKLDLNLEKNILEYFDKCKKLADYLTANPETGLDTPIAINAYKKFFEEEGFEFIQPYKNVQGSFLVRKKNSEHLSNKKVCLMAEYDALDKVGHACGHSISGASSALAFLALCKAYPQLELNVELMGTPGEEFPGGKVLLSDNSAFDNYEFAAMAHMYSGNYSGFNVLACNDRLITFTGKSSHASAAPQDGINALNAARIYMDAMDMWRQHLPEKAQFHGVVVNGGVLPSMVPDKVDLSFYFRAKNLKELDRLCEISENCCKAAALATDCTYTSTQEYLTYADLSNVDEALSVISDIFDLMGEEYTYSKIAQGSTDAGNVDYKIPVFHPLVNISDGRIIPLHSVEFEELMHLENASKAMINSATLLGNLVLFLDRDKERLATIKKQHSEARKTK